MPTIYNLRASNNATFRWTRDFSQIATAYDLATAVMRMQVRAFANAPDPAAYEWCSANTLGGVITYDPTTHLVVISASESDMAALSALGDLVYDFRLEWADGTDVTLFRGAFRWVLGVTREPTGPIVPYNAQLLTLTQAVALVEAGGTPGGTDGQVQINSGGLFGGITISGDGTLNTTTGALTVSKIGGATLGSAAFQPSTAFDAAGAAASAQSVSLQKASNLSDLANAATARTNLGLGTAATASASSFDAAGAAAAAQAASLSVSATTLPASFTASSLTSAAGGSFGSGAYAAAYSLPTASTSVLGGVKVDGSTITISGGVISSAGGYTLPAATNLVLGGVQPDGTTLTNTAGAISVTYGTAANTAARGNDSRITGAIQMNGAIGAATGSSLALGGATIGTNALAVTGTSTFSGISSYSASGLVISDGSNNGFGLSGGSPRAYVGGSNVHTFASTYYQINNTAAALWLDSDVVINRDAAGILAQRNGANAQVIRIYNTWSSAGVNFERAVFDWQGLANTLRIGTEYGGTGFSRDLMIVVGGVNRLSFSNGLGRWNAAGDFYASGVVKGASLISSALTYATLPAGPVAGQRAFITNSSVPQAGNSGAIVAGSGANGVPVYYDGANWRIG